MTRGRMRYQSPAACCWQLYRVTLWRSPCATTSRALDPHRCEAARLKQRWNYPVSLHLPSNQPLSLSLSESRHSFDIRTQSGSSSYSASFSFLLLLVLFLLLLLALFTSSQTKALSHLFVLPAQRCRSHSARATFLDFRIPYRMFLVVLPAFLFYIPARSLRASLFLPLLHFSPLECLFLVETHPLLCRILDIIVEQCAQTVTLCRLLLLLLLLFLLLLLQGLGMVRNLNV